MQSTLKTLAAAAALALSAAAHAVPVSLTKLTGVTGGTAAGTAVYKADLSSIGLTSILSIGIRDNSGALGGATGQFSGFDLDAIKLSTTDCADAACAKALAGLSVPLLAADSHATRALHEAALPFPCAWVFGHEGQGVAAAVTARCAQTLRIPQPGGEESLNVAAAAAICLYATRQAGGWQ